MSSAEALRELLHRIDGRSYGFYKDLRRESYQIGPWELCFDHVQGDPFAAPTRVHLQLPADYIRLPDWAQENVDARRASADYLQRGVRRELLGVPRRGGSGKSGLLEIARPGQEVLERTGSRVGSGGAVDLRVTVGLPAAGRRIRGRQASELLLEVLPQALDRVVRGIDEDELRRWVQTVEDQVALRSQLERSGLVAFLAAASVLPRRSGADDRPLRDALKLEVPEALRSELVAPHVGRLEGLGIPAGVTLIVGGGYHGKSTLLQALALGVYDHIPGDGREACVTCADAVTIRAEDGRAVRSVDLTPFIRDLPLGRQTERFDSEDASGSTSQAAAIVEALEAGASALLIDEDTAATNFMIRDARMRRLVPREKEPITPYLERVRQLWEERGVSSVLVVGGAGDYLDVADRVIQMDSYEPFDVTERARAVALELPLGEAAARVPGPWSPAAPRIPDARSFDPSRGRRAERVRSVKTRTIEFGREEIDVSLLSQLVDPGQCRAIGDILLLLSRTLCDGKKSVSELLDAIDAQIDARGLERVAERGFGDRARPRRYEIAAALNRMRSLRMA